jgi:hypothetical protein
MRFRRPGWGTTSGSPSGAVWNWSPARDPDPHDKSDFILGLGWGPWRQNPRFRGPGSFPHISLLGAQISNVNGAASRLRFGSRFLPQGRIRGNGPGPRKRGFWRQGPPFRGLKRIHPGGRGPLRGYPPPLIAIESVGRTSQAAQLLATCHMLDMHPASLCTPQNVAR